MHIHYNTYSKNITASLNIKTHFQRNSIFGSMPLRPSSTIAKLNISVQNWSSGFSHKAWSSRQILEERKSNASSQFQTDLTSSDIKMQVTEFLAHSMKQQKFKITNLVIVRNCSSKIILQQDKERIRGHLKI